MEKLNTQSIIDICTSQGFALAGVAPAIRSEHDNNLEEWLADGKHGEMEWMNRNIQVRLDPRQLIEGAKSVICVADRYGELEDSTLQPRHGRIARYARGKDYHKVMKRRLHDVCDTLREKLPDETFRVCVDTAPILERECAARAGLGAVGKHTLLIEQGIGSWLLLGVIVTTADFKANTFVQQDPCATCTRCIDACPTNAITPWSVDARKCISYLTIEHRSEIPQELFKGIGEWIFGCDICQEVCPHNQSTTLGTSASVHESYKPTLQSLNLLEVLNWDEVARRKAFQGLSMKRAKLGMMRRNAVIVAGNVLEHENNPELLAKLQTIAKGDEDEMVQITAVAVLEERTVS